MDEKPPIEPVLRALAAKARRNLDDHPTPEELVAYRAGELTAEDEERIRDHLALCRDCSQLLLDLKEFEDAAPEEEAGLSDVQVEAAWRRLRPRLEERKVLTSRRHGFASPRVAYGVAAALFLCTVGLSVWGLSLQRKVERLSQPQEVAYADLFTEEELERGPDDGRTVRPQGEWFVLFLYARRVPALPSYAGEIRPAEGGGEPLYGFNGLERKGEEGIIPLMLPSSLLPPGDYRLDLYGEGDRRQSLARFDFRVAGP